MSGMEHRVLHDICFLVNMFLPYVAILWNATSCINTQKRKYGCESNVKVTDLHAYRFLLCCVTVLLTGISSEHIGKCSIC
jgi:hypothetical protein